MVVLAKPDTVVDPHLAEDVVPFGEFPDRVVTEFASAVEGLLSNVAFAALSAIRSNTHRILTRFDRDLDPAYLGHRMLLPRPEDAERHLVDLILQELSAVLDSAEVAKRADYDAVNQLVEASVLTIEPVPNLSTSAERQKISLRELAMYLVKEGTDASEYPLSKSERKGMVDWIPRIFSQAKTGSSDTVDNIDKQWSSLMSNKIRYDVNPPELRLGALVRDSQAGLFLLCMQPVCDSVRLDSSTVFPFLPLAEESPGKSDIALKYVDGYHCLKLQFKFKDLSLISFEPASDTSGVVKAERAGGDESWVFMPTGGERAPLEWVGELRDSFAHKFANMFATSVSRVGVDESEWFRRPR